jgi:hypothetical protein
MEALALWRDMLRKAGSDYERRIAARYIRQITVEIQLELIHRAIAAFRARVGRNPVSLEELHHAGDLGAVPVDPDGRPFVYDRATGQARAAAETLRERLRR